MTPTVTRKLTVTFNDGLPLGTHASFKHESQHWIAFPLDKHQRILTVTDRLIGIMGRFQRELTNWLQQHPEDAGRVGMLLGLLARADATKRQAAVDKIKAQTA